MSLINNEETIVKTNCEVIKAPLKQQEQVFVAKDKWEKDIEFLLSCIALSVGLGNVWRFPFTALGEL
jgi:Sodium:neurotransmitter symporter family